MGMKLTESDLENIRRFEIRKQILKNQEFCDEYRNPDDSLVTIGQYNKLTKIVERLKKRIGELEIKEQEDRAIFTDDLLKQELQKILDGEK